MQDIETITRAKVFLGGTCAESTWREHIIPLLECDYFNPVVKDWTPDCQVEELRQREICDIILYTITAEMQGVYSIAEVIDDCHKRPERVVFCLIEDGFTPSQVKSLKAVASMVLRLGGRAAYSIDVAADVINHMATGPKIHGKPRTPLLAVDCVILDGDDRVLLIERRNFPHGWALPGGFVDVGETVEAAMAREVLEETGLSLRDVRPLGVYSEPDRDPRGHTVSVVFIARAVGTANAADDAKSVTWATLYDALDVLQLAFDHRQIVRDAFDKIFYGHIMI